MLLIDKDTRETKNPEERGFFLLSSVSDVGSLSLIPERDI